MIWFACKSCGKTHGRPENSAGTLIFCDCGQGVAVPWESTVAPPAMPSFPVPASKPEVPTVRWSPQPIVQEDRNAPPPVVLPAPRRKPTAPKKRDKNFCFNHQDLAVHKTCSGCGEGFCGDCIVEFQGKPLCGPCKNFQVKLAQKPPRVSGRAVAALTLSLLTSPFVFCPLVAGGSIWAVVLTGAMLLPQIIGMGLSLLALRDTESNPRITGRGLAITALLSASVFLLLSGFLMFTGARLA